MERIQKLKVMILNVFHQLRVLGDHHVRCTGEGQHFRTKWEKLHLLGLIIQQLGLLFLSRDISELASDSRIPQTNKKWGQYSVLGSIDDMASDKDHC